MLNIFNALSVNPTKWSYTLKQFVWGWRLKVTSKNKDNRTRSTKEHAAAHSTHQVLLYPYLNIEVDSFQCAVLIEYKLFQENFSGVILSFFDIGIFQKSSRCMSLHCDLLKTVTDNLFESRIQLRYIKGLTYKIEHISN